MLSVTHSKPDRRLAQSPGAQQHLFMEDGVWMQEAVIEALQETEARLLGVQVAHCEGHGWVLLVDFAEDAAAGLHFELVLLVQGAFVHCGLLLIQHPRLALP